MLKGSRGNIIWASLVQITFIRMSICIDLSYLSGQGIVLQGMTANNYYVDLLHMRNTISF